MSTPPDPPSSDLPPGRQDSVLDTVAARTGKAPRVLLRDRASGEDRSPVVNARAGALYEMPAGRDTYQIMGEIARGGMGVVLKAHDKELGRDVAVKVLHEDLAKKPESLHRFVEEAQIGGQLQHPGIVPVYEMGLMAEDVPYFTMKLVKGRTLAALLADRENVRSDRRRLLDIFSSVCQTMAYAHSRGVIHRDLKPANVMVGAFGEVQVVDWGLAKVLRSGGAADERRAKEARASISIIETVRSDGSASGTDSMVGSVMGTPAYMPPEQATGDLEKLDERADVFSLGAVLCEILTGLPPYTGESERTLVEAAYARQEAAQARLDECDADPDLVELVRECLKPAPAIRPRSAEVLSERIRDHLTGLEERAHQAQIEAAEARVRAVDERRARRLTAGLAASVLVLVLGAGGGWLWIGEQRHARELETAQRVESALDEAELARAEGDWSGADAAVERARVLADDGDAIPSLRERVSRLSARIEEGAASARLEAENARANERFRIALEEIRRGAHLDQIEATGLRPEKAYAEVFAAHGLEIDQGSVEEAAGALLARGQGIDVALVLDQWTDARRRSGDEAGAVRLIEIAHLVDPDPVRADLREAIANRDAEALDWLVESSLADQPPSTLQLLGSALERLERRETSLEVLRQAVQLYPDAFTLQAELARLLADGTPAEKQEALAAYAACLALRPTGIEIRRQLAGLLLDREELEDAGRVLEAALTLAPEDADLNFLLGSSYRRRSNFAPAEAAFRRVLECDPTASVEADALLGLGKLHRQRGDLDEALEYLEQALELAPNANIVHVELGHAYRAAKRFEEALEISLASVELKPTDPWNHIDVGAAYKGLGETEKSAEAFRLALRYDPKSAVAHNNLGARLEELGQLEEALHHFTKALEFDPELTVAQNNRARMLVETGRVEDALESLRRSLELDPEDARTHLELAMALEDTGAPEAAVASYEEALRLEPDSAAAHNNFGTCLEELGRRDEALEHFERATECRPDLAVAHNNLGRLLAWSGEYERALESHGRSLELAPDVPRTHRDRGATLIAMGNHAEAIEAYRDALSVRETPDALNRLAWYLATDPNDAESHAEEAVALAEEAVALESAGSFHGTLGTALYRRGDYEKAIESFDRAIAADGGASAYEGFFLAMCNDRLERLDQGQEWLATSIRWMEENAPDDPELVRFRREAEALHAELTR